MMSADLKVKAGKRPDWAAFPAAIMLIAIAAVIFYDVQRLDVAGGYSGIGPASIPWAVALCLTGLAVWTVMAAFRRDFPTREHQEAQPVLWIVAGLVAQMSLLSTAGFSIATGLLFALTAAGFGKRRLWLSIPVGIGLSFVIWMVFGQLLQLSLPAGPLERLFF
jgi:putative tricarboxylic transport membrane protein